MSAHTGEGSQRENEYHQSALVGFYGKLAELFPEPTSARRLVSGIDLAPKNYIDDESAPKDRWYTAVEKLRNEGLLLRFAQHVKEDRDGVYIEEIEKLIESEKARLQDIESRHKAAVVEKFDKVHEELKRANNFVRKLCQTEHPAEADLGVMKSYFNSLYQLLDSLYEAQSAAAARVDERAQASAIEGRINQCVDAFQYYNTLLQYDRADDGFSQFNATKGPGRLEKHASDEEVLLRARARLRGALNRLADSGASS